MRSTWGSCWAGSFLLFAGLLTHSPIAAGEPPLLPPRHHLAPDVRSRLAEAARSSPLEPWQREFMLQVAQGGLDRAAAASSPALPAVIARSTGIAADDGTWIQLPPPTARDRHVAIYDPVRDRMVVFGGSDGSLRNDVWTVSLGGSPVWSLLTPSGSPPAARAGHSAIYDPVRDRMVMFGGDATGLRNDVWELSLSGSPAWSLLTPSGSPPASRAGHSAIYDPVRDRMVVFGGSSGTPRNDVWALSLAGSPTWSALAPAGGPPSARYNHSAIYDPVRDQMVVFAGFGGSSFRSDAWALSLSGGPAWSDLAPAGSLPTARAGHAAIFDPVRDRMVVFGGDAGAGGHLNDVRYLSLSGSPAWSQPAILGSPPAARARHSATYDPVRDQMVVLWGSHLNYHNDTWELSLPGSPAWSLLDRIPSARREYTAIYDPARDRMVMFGGFAGGYSNDVWALSLSGIPVWSLLAPAGTLPAARTGHAAIYDPVRDRMVVFGGGGSIGLLNDVWELSLSGIPAWSLLAPAGTLPAARSGHEAIYDPVRDRMVVFGGGGPGYLNDVWALSLAGSPAWSPLAPAGGPPTGRTLHTAIYDPLRDRMLVFGGYDGSIPFLNDAWELALAGSPAWSALAPVGSPPTGRSQHTAIYDPPRDRMVVFGGSGGGTWLNDTWELSLSGSPAWGALGPAGSPPSGRYGHMAIYDPVRDRMVVFSGAAAANDVWALAWATPVSVHPGVDAPHRRLELAPARPNPSRGVTTLEFELGEPERVVLEVFDCQSRRVKRIVDEQFASGRHVTTWRGEDDRGHPVESGVYFVRIQTTGFQATRRMVRIR